MVSLAMSSFRQGKEPLPTVICHFPQNPSTGTVQLSLFNRGAALRNLNVDAGSVLDQRQSGSRPRSSAKRRRRSSANPSSTQSKGTSTATTATKPKLTAAEDKGSKETTAKAPVVSAKTIPKEGGEPWAS